MNTCNGSYIKKNLVCKTCSGLLFPLGRTWIIGWFIEKVGSG
jgi:hypothetical protein